MGLSAIHAKGLIHRDLKPANIWLEAGTGRVKILDLGLADEVANLRQGVCAGTPAYMSPEQIVGEPLDFRTDLFSLGAIFYECLTARKAFPGKHLTETIDLVQRAKPIPLSQANPATPVPIRELVTALLQKDRSQRPVSAQAVLELLPQSSEPSTRSTVQPIQPPSPQRRWLLPLLMAALVLMLGALSFFAYLAGRQQPSTPTLSTLPTPPTPPTTAPALPPSVPVTPLAIESLEVTPLQPLPGNRWQELQPLRSPENSAGL